MSHKITDRDEVRLAKIPELFEGIGWHGKGIPTEKFSLETLKRILFSHTYCPAGILVNEKFIEVSGEKYAVATDDSLPISGAVGKDWDTPQNQELFELFREALGGSAYKIVSCGTIDNRTEFFVDAKGEVQKAANRDISPYVALHRSFGGIGKIRVCGHSRIVQCGNTTALFIREADSSDGLISTKNTKFVKTRLPWLQTQIELAHGVQGEFIRALNDAQNEKVDETTAVSAFVGVMASENLSNRTVNRVNRLYELFNVGEGNNGETIADWHSAITDYYTHESSGGDENNTVSFRDKQFYSSEFGTARNRKAEITSELLGDGELHLDTFGEWIERGRQIIDGSSREVVKNLVYS
mgnify:CR=1 FL=1